MAMAKTFNSQEVEKKIYLKWVPLLDEVRREAIEELEK